MASGKTTIGKSLAEKKGYSFIDTDEWISNKMNTPISEYLIKEVKNILDS